MLWLAFLIPYLMLGAVITATVLSFDRDIETYSQKWWFLLALGTAFWGIGVLYLGAKKLWEWVKDKVRGGF